VLVAAVAGRRARNVYDIVLFGENPVGIEVEIEGISKGDAALLQKAAWQVFKSAG
jgi:hypothetical protein